MREPSLIRQARLELLFRCTPSRRWLDQARNHQWVFVAGCNRSGKTTLSNLFSHHPEVSVIPNANMHTRALLNSGRAGCPHIWVEKLDLFRMTESDSRAPAARLAFDWLHYHERPRRVMMAESDIPSVQMRWLQEVFPGASLVGVVRNGYAVAEGLRLKEGYSIQRCARQWSLATETMLADVPLMHRFHLVRYEEFVERPFEVIPSLCRFLGLEQEPLLPFLRQGWRLGNTDRNDSLLRNANAELIGRLSPQEIETISQTAGPLLRHFGYTALNNA